MDRNLNLANEKELTALGKALSSETRIRILHLLGKEPLCVNEIAEMLGIPSSSAALNIRVLEDAGLIRTELKPAARGSMKMCIPQEGKDHSGSSAAGTKKERRDHIHAGGKLCGL